MNAYDMVVKKDEKKEIVGRRGKSFRKWEDSMEKPDSDHNNAYNDQNLVNSHHLPDEPESDNTTLYISDKISN